MIIKEIIQKLRTTMIDARGQESHFESWLTLNEGICDAIDMLKELAKQEQGEPVGTVGELFDERIIWKRELDRNLLVYTTPQQRTWVGLTDEEFQFICTKFRASHGGWVNMLALEIEAKLKEKNT